MAYALTIEIAMSGPGAEDLETAELYGQLAAEHLQRLGYSVVAYFVRPATGELPKVAE